MVVPPPRVSIDAISTKPNPAAIIQNAPIARAQCVPATTHFSREALVLSSSPPLVARTEALVPAIVARVVPLPPPVPFALSTSLSPASRTVVEGLTIAFQQYSDAMENLNRCNFNYSQTIVCSLETGDRWPRLVRRACCTGAEPGSREAGASPRRPTGPE